MHLEQADITALSASQDSGVLTLRQLDTQLVSLKRQVGWRRLDPERAELLLPAASPAFAPHLQVQSIKQNNSMLKHSLTEGVDGVRPAEVSLGPARLRLPPPDVT